MYASFVPESSQSNMGLAQWKALRFFRAWWSKSLANASVSGRDYSILRDLCLRGLAVVATRFNTFWRCAERHGDRPSAGNAHPVQPAL